MEVCHFYEHLLPCEQVDGTILSLDEPDSWRKTKIWLEFEGLQNFSMLGRGDINGRGERWWAQACRPTMKVKLPSILFSAQFCTSVRGYCDGACNMLQPVLQVRIKYSWETTDQSFPSRSGPSWKRLRKLF